MSQQTEHHIIGILFHFKLFVIKKGFSKLCYFQKICANKNSSKTSHLQVLARTGASVSPLRASWMSSRSCLLLLCQIMINTRRNLAEFYNVSFARSLAWSQSSWPCFCNNLKKWPHTLSRKLGTQTLLFSVDTEVFSFNRK